MIYFKLLYNFFIVGLFSFGGAYSVIPLIKDTAKVFNVLTDEMLLNFIAIAESTPGPISVNLATFVGTEVADIYGAIVATFAEVLPAFLIILIIAIYFQHFLDNKYVAFVLSIIRPSILGIVTFVGLQVFYKNFDDFYKLINIEMQYIKKIIILIILFIIMFFYKKFTKKSIGTIIIIVISAILGIAINLIL